MSTFDQGNNLAAAIEQFGGTAKEWLDLASAVSPYTWKVPELPTKVWHRLPGDKLLRKAIAAARKYYGVPDQAACTVGNGSQAFIQNLPFCFKPQAVAIIGYTYPHHGACWRRAGHQVFVADGLASAEDTARIVIVVNPNNPDGRTYDPEFLTSMARRLGSKGGLLVVDEAFCDVVPELSVAPFAGMDGLLVMRSVGKFFGLSGMRLGFAFGAPLMIERLSESLGPWPASGPALAVASKALADRRYITRTRRRLGERRKELENLLKKNDITIIGGSDLVVLIEIENAQALFEHLAQHHILLRPLPGRNDWLRISIPGTSRAIERLSDALSNFTQ